MIETGKVGSEDCLIDLEKGQYLMLPFDTVVDFDPEGDFFTVKTRSLSIDWLPLLDYEAVIETWNFPKRCKNA